MEYSGTAYGSVILFGEYAVAFHHSLAIMMAISESITARFCWRNDKKVHLFCALGDFSGSFEHFEKTPEWEFIANLLRHWPQTAIRGWELKLEGSVPIAQGLGSSSALLVALFIALEKAHGNQPTCDRQTLKQIVSLLRQASPHASGADCAAALYGGIIVYDPQLYDVRPLSLIGPWYWAYCGYKTTTIKMLQRLEHRWDASHTILTQIAMYTQQAVQLWAPSNILALKALMRAHHQCQVALGTFDRGMLGLYQKLTKHSPQSAVKISGSGCGDGFIVLQGEALSDSDFENKQWGQFLIPAPYRESVDTYVG